jgi:hypothetical protein
MPENDAPHSDEPTGERWDEATVAQKYPALAERFGF